MHPTTHKASDRHLIRGPYGRHLFNIAVLTPTDGPLKSLLDSVSVLVITAH